jgi:hypothetical protein
MNAPFRRVSPFTAAGNEDGGGHIANIGFAKGVYTKNKTPFAPAGKRFQTVMESYERGWIKIVGRKVVDRKCGLVVNNFVVPEREDLGDHDQTLWEPTPDGKGLQDCWVRTAAVILIDVETSEPVRFSSISPTGVAAIGNLATAYGYVTDSRPGEDPIIELMVEEYQNKFGRQVKPLLAIVGWALTGATPVSTPNGVPAVEGAKAPLSIAGPGPAAGDGREEPPLDAYGDLDDVPF